MRELQELTAARDRFYRERTRFARLGEFSTRAIRARSLQSFAEIVAAAMLDVFEFDFAGIWILGGDGELPPGTASVAGCLVSPAGLGTVREWLRRRLPELGAVRIELLAPAEAEPLHAVLPPRRLVLASCGESGTHATALLLGGLPEQGASFHHELEAEQIESFKVFVRQVAALVGNRVSRSTVEEQMRRIQVSEEAQRVAREQAETANRAKSVFLANMSHELRTPLNGVLGMLQLLQKSQPSAEQLGLIEAAELSATRLLEVIDDILDLSRIEAGKVELGVTPFGLGDLVREVARSLDGRAQAKGIRLDLELANDLPAQLRGDPLRLRQILSNLVANGVKFTSTGSVRIAVWAMPPGQDDRVWIEFSVRDTGIGIPGEVQATLFAPFAQADASTTRKHGGAGLGLAISRLIVELMGGRIWVESEAEKGADFRFRLPFRLVPSATASSTPPPSRPVPAQRLFAARVLVVEENLISRRVARLMLESLGIEVDLASGGEAAVRTATEGRHQLMLLDGRLPDVDGIEVTRRIRCFEAETGAPRLPIIALIANAGDRDGAACLAAGMDGYLARPLRRASLIEKLREFLTPASP